MQILALEGAVSAVAGLEEAREVEAHMMEELAHQAVDKGKGGVGQYWGKQEVGQKEEACRILDTRCREGEERWRCWPLPEGDHSPQEVEHTDGKELQRYHRRNEMPPGH